MLTITEATDAILALDTDADIIKGACWRVILPEAVREHGHSEKKDKMIEILRGFASYTAPDVILILTELTAIAAAAACKIGHEAQMAESTIGLFVTSFVAARKQKIAEKAKTDPIGAVQDVNAMLTSLAAYGSER